MLKKSKKILTEISAGELLDKLTILEIKLSKIKDKNKVLEIKKEYASLSKTKKINIKVTPKLNSLIKKLKKTNLQLWDIEDKKRNCEKEKKFDSNFISIARKVYLNNDKRADIKSKINKYLGSNINEVKQYVNY